MGWSTGNPAPILEGLLHAVCAREPGFSLTGGAAGVTAA